MIIIPREDKAKSLALIEQVFQQFLYTGLSPTQLDLLRQHLQWIKSQTEDLQVAAQLETIPFTRTTKLSLEFRFASLPKYSPN